jgi:NHLM bacteriocin system ABC transporter peptidase/ATP-binding protein
MFALAGPRRVRTPTVLQMEAAECGAASLAIILGFFKRFVPLQDLRARCGVDRDGSNAANLLKAARSYGLVAKGFQRPVEMVLKGPFPSVVFWTFNHFLVVEGASRGRVHLNDPALGPRSVDRNEFARRYSGIVLTFAAGPAFRPEGRPPRVLPRLVESLTGHGQAVAVLLVLSLVLVVPGLVVPGFIKIFVDEVLVGRLGGWIGPLAIGMTVAALMQLFASWLVQSLLLRTELQLVASRSFAFVWQVLRLPVGYFSHRYVGDIVMRVQSNDQIARLVARDLGGVCLDLASALFLLVVMMTYEPRLAAIVAALAGLNVAVLELVRRRRSDLAIHFQTQQAKLFGTTVVGLQTIETLKAAGAERDFFAKWAGNHARCLDAEQRLALIEHVTALVPPLSSGLATAAILLVGSFTVMDGQLTLGGLIAFQALMASFAPPVQRLVEVAGKGQQAKADFERVDDVGQTALDWRHRPGSAPTSLVCARGDLELRNVAFAYGPLDPPFIADFSLNVAAGQWVALVGGSGSGKTTIGSLICGLYPPSSGLIMLDGRPLESWDRLSLSAALARVDQDIRIFAGTVRDNITLWDTTIPEHAIIRAAEDAGLADVIAGLPGGLDGRVDEDGRNLSGGQRQRLEIARALVRDPAVIVLDEATSALDPVTEQQVAQAIRRRGMTCVVVAHRLSTIRDCDEIIVLARGTIAERGTHDQLMARRGTYAQLMQEA